MLNQSEVMTANDNIKDLDNIAFMLRDMGFYWEADMCEKAADEYNLLVDKVRMNAANSN